MRNRQFPDGARSSARHNSRHCTSAKSFADEEAEICRSTKTVCLASTHKTDKRPLKQTKCERSSAVKLEIQELVSKSRDSPFQKRLSKTGNELQRLNETPDNGSMPRRRIPKVGRSVHGAEGVASKENPGYVGTGCVPKSGNRSPLVVSEESFQSNGSHVTTEEASCDGDAFPNEAKGGAQKAPIQLDNSVFMDEDSNQPMPLGRFFENADLMQEIPPVVPAYPSMSRREFRKLHFKAKEDDDDDDVD